MTQSEQSLDPAATQAWLSRPRYQRYLDAASGDHDLALRLYVWNADIAAAGMVDVGHLEVALRNAYDRQLTARFPDWSIDPAAALFRREQGIAKARSRQRASNTISMARITDAKRGLGVTPTHGEIVAALMFGFWASLTHPERAPLFWNPMIHRAFPSRTRRAHVHDLTSRIVKFRNRLAHNEPVFSTRTGLRQRMADVGELFDLVAPEAARFAAASSRVDNLLGQCPVPNLITL